MHWTDAYKLIEIICDESGYIFAESDSYTQRTVDERLKKLSEAFPNDSGVKEAIK